MKKVWVLISVLLFLPPSLWAQPSGTGFSNGGQTSTAANAYQLTWTLGEVVAGESVEGEITVTAGFLIQGSEDQDAMEDPLAIEEFLEAFDVFELGPNPGQGSFRLKIAVSKAQNIRINLRTLSGRSISASVLPMYPNQPYEEIFNLHHLSEGIYFIDIMNDRGKITKKILKQ